MLRQAGVLARAAATSQRLGIARSTLSARHFSRVGDDTHPDFQPVAKGGAADSAHDFIAKDVAQNDVIVYMKGTPSAPQCGFSNMVCRILDGHDVPYASRNVLEDPELRQSIKAFTAWPTIPQVFIGGQFVGGSDILMGMHTSGELAQTLAKLKGKK